MHGPVTSVHQKHVQVVAALVQNGRGFVCPRSAFLEPAYPTTRSEPRAILRVIWTAPRRRAEEAARRELANLVESIHSAGRKLAHARDDVIKEIGRVGDNIQDELKGLDKRISAEMKAGIHNAIQAAKDIKNQAGPLLQDAIIKAITTAFPVLKAAQYAAALAAIKESYAHLLALRSLFQELIDVGG